MNISWISWILSAKLNQLQDEVIFLCMIWFVPIFYLVSHNIPKGNRSSKTIHIIKSYNPTRTRNQTLFNKFIMLLPIFTIVFTAKWQVSSELPPTSNSTYYFLKWTEILKPQITLLFLKTPCLMVRLG